MTTGRVEIRFHDLNGVVDHIDPISDMEYERAMAVKGSVFTLNNGYGVYEYDWLKVSTVKWFPSMDADEPVTVKTGQEKFNLKGRTMHQLKVLNHGSLELIDSMGDDSSVIRAARVSYAKDSVEKVELMDAKDEKLIAYLLKNNHTSPFEHVIFTFHVVCPIFVARQWHRHRTGSYNEISARYTELPEEFFIPALDTIGLQSKSNKQMRNFEPNENADIIRGVIMSSGEAAFNYYRGLISLGCPREVARTVLPVGTYTRFYYTIDLHNVMHFMRLRLHEHAQYEIQVYGQAMLDIIKDICPVTMAYFEEHLSTKV